MKIIVNRCYGGVSFSDKAVELYAKRKGLTLYPEEVPLLKTYWTVPREDRGTYLDGQDYRNATPAERSVSDNFYEANTISQFPSQKDRYDPDWVAVVEELGEEANGDCAELEVVEIPDDVNWEIENYDGYETIREVSRTW